jgi:hypothetical protein
MSMFVKLKALFYLNKLLTFRWNQIERERERDNSSTLLLFLLPPALLSFSFSQSIILFFALINMWIFSYDFSECSVLFICTDTNTQHRRSQWPCGLRRGSAAARLLGLWVRIPPRAWMSVCCECCVLSGRGVSDGLITRPEESYRVWCV